MITLTLETLFGPLILNISDLDADGGRSGSIQSGFQRDQDEDEDPALDAVEWLVLAHACAGVDVESDAYLEGLNTTLEGIDNRS